ncbi:MAG: hypothetical protein QMD43_06105 [Thermodesulfovibrio sp.]|uniref:hypothetical protein n=2 Tax=unclassified Thermodesulfovibrio TaxID=2645936 RepID=UPI00083A7CE4|nr:hypothetical protein [Thermodesulfovibrio sp. N1]MDI1471389.1 hypothetical protein [Thermodesulfovibrio sp. 1176]MDI6714584.1 hypothetical protein [Thermodesulfovibrio sp.]ODA44342.1 hypothetical protein THER_0966 [Thermodesulfovibrio sp. N1]
MHSDHKIKISINFNNLKELKSIGVRFLNTERWSGNVLLMVIDAAFTSVGVNYFQVVLPKVREFEKEFVRNGKVTGLSSFCHFDYKKAFYIWKNERSWQVAKEIAQYLSTLSKDDKNSLRIWAKNASIDKWENDPIGKIKGVGLITYQYLRMMGGVDTVMPDKIVKKVINRILIETGEMPVNDNLNFIKTVENIAKINGFRPIEICLMTWFLENPERISEMP